MNYFNRKLLGPLADLPCWLFDHRGALIPPEGCPALPPEPGDDGRPRALLASTFRPEIVTPFTGRASAELHFATCYREVGGWRPPIALAAAQRDVDEIFGEVPGEARVKLPPRQTGPKFSRAATRPRGRPEWAGRQSARRPPTLPRDHDAPRSRLVRRAA